MLLDFAVISVLLALGHILRWRIAAFQFLYIPAPVLAGVAALIGGEQGLRILPFSRTTDGGLAMAAYPLDLVAILFATLFLGHQPQRPPLRSVLRNVGDTFFFNVAGEIGQYGFALLFGGLVIAPLFPDLSSGFSLMMPAGFSGGHGTATVVGGTLLDSGWREALSIGYTFATIGLIVGVLFGLTMINLGARLGWTRFVQSASELPPSLRSGFLSADEQSSIGQATVSPMSLDPLAWHVALVLCAFAGARATDAAFRALLPGGYSLPLFAVAMLLGAGIQALLERARLGSSVDRQITRRIGSTVSDYLIAFGIGSIELQIVVENIRPIILLSLFGIIYSVGFVVVLGPRMLHDNWFERAIFVFGWLTGVVAIGILLLRIVDPRMQSRTLDDYGVAYLGISIIEILLLVSVPPLVARAWIAPTAAGLIAIFLLCVVLSCWLVRLDRRTAE